MAETNTSNTSALVKDFGSKIGARELIKIM